MYPGHRRCRPSEVAFGDRLSFLVRLGSACIANLGTDALNHKAVPRAPGCWGTLYMVSDLLFRLLEPYRQCQPDGRYKESPIGQSISSNAVVKKAVANEAVGK